MKKGIISVYDIRKNSVMQNIEVDNLKKNLLFFFFIK